MSKETEKLTEQVKNKTIVSAETNTAKKPKPKQITVRPEKLHPFAGHPYKVTDNEAMEELKTSIAENGLLSRILVRPLEGKTDEYEIISGHRRVHAAEQIGMKEVPAVVYAIDRDAATVLMVDSNCQREELTPMEKAKAYRMKAEALSHRGAASGQVVPKSDDNRTTAKIGATAGESYKTVQRLIRLTYLVPELQQFVDEGKMKVSPAVEISFLDEDRQRDIVDRIDDTEAFPSHAQARRMKALFEEGKLDYDAVSDIMAETKPNQREKVKIPADEIRRRIGKSLNDEDIIKYLYSAVDYYKKHIDRQRDWGAR